MARFLFFVLLGLVAWAWWSRQSDKIGQQPSAPPQAPKGPAANASTEPDVMVQCAHCGVHLPQSEACAGAMAGKPKWYCSPAHRELGPGQPD